MPASKRIAVWMSDKKLQKMNWLEFEAVCLSHGFEVFKLDLDESLQAQEPFCVFLHKLTDIIASANLGDIKNSISNSYPLFQNFNKIQEIEKYISQNPTLTVIDPLPNVRKLLDRYNCYSIIHSTNLYTYDVFTPNFCTLQSTNLDVLKQQLKLAKVTYPFICKPLLGHGSRKAHEMSIIFNEKCLIDIRTPCVAQSFINHNAVLFKIFIVGKRHCFVERPSLKNFHACESETIYFDSSDVSKADSKSRLSVLDPDDVTNEKVQPNKKTLEVIANTLRKAFGMELLGVDVVIERNTKKYAIIDVNAYPGYDGFPNFFDALLECISKKITSDYT
ncbi:hypothetical protein NQ315_002191 [Exocentrus adspersus]|uniref:Inositol-tetrakisphosphate 1-kinase n=1 Tax=Exocentrus adspersus TaxID=1586481 RepID=A0AAV8VZ22_9CUCU|nr:hypothetical protein NQ315_002191 [Exocentrus adspersus]